MAATSTGTPTRRSRPLAIATSWMRRERSDRRAQRGRRGHGRARRVPAATRPGAAVSGSACGDDDPRGASPTSIVRGPDGALYVGELTGFPFAAGSARVFRIDPHSVAPPTVYATGFTCVMDLDFDDA